MIKISPSTSRHNGSRRSVSYLIHRSSLNMLSFNARYAPPIVFDLGSLYLFLVMTSQAPIRRQLVYKVRRLHINGWAHNFFFFLFTSWAHIFGNWHVTHTQPDSGCIIHANEWLMFFRDVTHRITLRPAQRAPNLPIHPPRRITKQPLRDPTVDLREGR